MKSRTIFTIASAALFVTACNLDLTPSTSITYDETLSNFRSETNVDAFRMGLYSSFRNCLYGAMSMAEEFMCDGFNATISYGNNYGDIHRADNGFTASDLYVTLFWAIHYSAIKDCNIYLEQYEKLEEGELKAYARTPAKGEAHFFRAASYLQLVRHFSKDYDPETAAGDLGVPLVVVQDQKEKPARATVARVYEQIKADLDSAAVILAEVPGMSRSYRVTIDAVHAVYARYYLDVEDYAKAAEYADALLASGRYPLSSDDAQMEGEYTDDSGSEPILQLYADLSETPNINIEYTHADNVAGLGLTYKPSYLPSKRLLDCYSQADLRFRNWFNRTDYISISGINLRGSVYTFVKYRGNPALYTGSVPNGAQAEKPFLIGEMYLIAAEAHLKNREADLAAERLNALQRARKAAATEATLAAIQTEWFRETVGEGLRLSCLKRWGEGCPARTPQTAALNAGVLMTGAAYGDRVLAADDFHFVWPIPAYDMQVNDNLVQNAGYAEIGVND